MSAQNFTPHQAIENQGGDYMPPLTPMASWRAERAKTVRRMRQPSLMSSQDVIAANAAGRERRAHPCGSPE